eukprot:6641352-Karenia_brevis.AAC.1
MMKHTNEGHTETSEDFYTAWKSSFEIASHHTLSNQEVKAKRPWISQRTLNLIFKRQQAHIDSRWSDEMSYNKLIKKSVKQDRTSWSTIYKVEEQGWQDFGYT